MIYAILGQDREDSIEIRRQNRPAHLERIRSLQAQGRLVIAGPHPAIDNPDPGAAGFSGSLILAEFPSLEEAQAWAEADPYVVNGVFAHIAVKPFVQVLP